jgi:hypothetical protein
MTTCVVILVTTLPSSGFAEKKISADHIGGRQWDAPSPPPKAAYLFSGDPKEKRFPIFDL